MLWRRGGYGLLLLAVISGFSGCTAPRPLPLPPSGILDPQAAGSTEVKTAKPAKSQEPAARKTTAKKSVQKKTDPKPPSPKKALSAKSESALTGKAAVTVARLTKAEQRAAALEAKQEAAAAKQAAADEKARQREEAKQAALAKKEAAAAAKQEEATRRQEARQAAAEAKAAATAKAAKKDAPDSPVSAETTIHILQPNDEIDIQIYREPDLSGLFKLGLNGEIRHPLLGAVPMAGKTLEAAERDFTRRLNKDYLVNPRVIFRLASTQSSQIVVLGEVKKPGVYPLEVGETMTLLQAIAGAGGFTDLASPDRISLVRRLPDGGQTTMKIRVSDLLSKRRKQPDLPLEPNDVIMVPQVCF